MGGRYWRICRASAIAFCVAALVKAGIVHDRHGPGRRFGDAFAGDPGMNDIAVDVEIARQSRRQQARHKRADDIGATRRAPVMTAKVSLAPWPMAMGARHVGGKAAFVNVNDGAARRLMGLDASLEAASLVFVRFGMGERFLYVTPTRPGPRHPDNRVAKPAGAACPSSPREQDPFGRSLRSSLGTSPPGTNLPKIGLETHSGPRWCPELSTRSRPSLKYFQFRHLIPGFDRLIERRHPFRFQKVDQEKQNPRCRCASPRAV